MILRVQFMRRTKEAPRYNLYEEQKKLPLWQRALEMLEDVIQNMGPHSSITAKMMTSIICFNHINWYMYYSALERSKCVHWVA